MTEAEDPKRLSEDDARGVDLPQPPKSRAKNRGNGGSAGRNSREERHPALPGAGSGLPPTARRLLEAARRLLVRSGYNSLSVEAIGREAGENKALIRYYFGSKNGLLIALVDWLISDTLWQTRQRLAAMSGEHGPSELVTAMSQSLLDDLPSYTLFFDLLPRLLANPSMAKQFAELYRLYREVNIQALWAGREGEPPVEVRDLATMTVALTDGLAVQVLAEPGSVDISRMHALWASFVDQTLAVLPPINTTAEAVPDSGA